MASLPDLSAAFNALGVGEAPRSPHCCGYCGKSEGQTKLFVCGGCVAIKYCGPECQKKDWRIQHKSECRAR